MNTYSNIYIFTDLIIKLHKYYKLNITGIMDICISVAV